MILTVARVCDAVDVEKASHPDALHVDDTEEFASIRQFTTCFVVQLSVVFHVCSNKEGCLFLYYCVVQFLGLM